MLPRRRIFKPARAPRRLGTVAVTLVAAGGAVLVATALPRDLFGSAPRDVRWTATAAQVRVVDGDTLVLGDRPLRLAGLRAPTRGESCRTPAGTVFDCGSAAAEALARLVTGHTVECRLAGRGRDGRLQGVCQAGEAEVNAGLVAAGWALAEGNAGLAAAETAARQGGRGLWGPGGSRPEGWRQAP